MLAKVHPEGDLSVVAELEGPVGDVARIFVGGLLEVGRDLVEGGAGDMVPVELFRNWFFQPGGLAELTCRLFRLGTAVL